MRECDNLHFF